jgi:hypothetical protein
METTNRNRVNYKRDLSGRTAVAALFKDKDDAEKAIEELRQEGFTRDQIGIAMRDRTAQGEMIESTGTHAAQGAAAGLVGGGLIGGLVGFLVATGALAIPGIGPVVAGGVLANTFGIVGGTAVAGAGIGAAAGGILGALVGMGIPEHEAHYFEEGVRSGSTLVTVTAPGRASEAVKILEHHHGDTAASTYADYIDNTNTIPSAGAVTGAGNEYVVKKVVHQETQTIDVPVTREEYVVEGADGTTTNRSEAA